MAPVPGGLQVYVEYLSKDALPPLESALEAQEEQGKAARTLRAT